MLLIMDYSHFVTSSSNAAEPLETSLDYWSPSSPFNSTPNSSSDPSSDAAKDLEKKVLKLSVLSVMFVIAVIGNGLVILALLFRRKNKLSRMYYLILHLCVSDLIVAFLHILPQICWVATGQFKGGDALCRIIKIVQVFGPYLSSFVLVATAIDRYLAICYPLSSSPWTERHSHRMIWIAWIVSALLSVPQAFIFSYKYVDSRQYYECWADFVGPYGEKVYITYFVITNTLMPFVVLVYTYSAICWAVWVNFRHKQNSPQGDFNGPRSSSSPINYNKVHVKANSTEANGLVDHFEKCGDGSERTPINPRAHSVQGISRAKIKTVKLTIVVILCYIACSMPFSCVMLITVYAPGFQDTAFYKSLSMSILSLIASLNSCVNPWIFLAFNENLVQSLRQLICCHDREQRTSQRFLPTQYSRSSISDVIAGNKIVNLGNGVVGWSASGKREISPSGRTSGSTAAAAATLMRQNTRLTSLTDDRCSERALLTSSSPSTSTITSELAVKNLGGDESPPDTGSGRLAIRTEVTPPPRRDSNASATTKLVCSGQHEEQCAKDKCCTCEEMKRSVLTAQ